jgi:pimeloyl-ACP methyl ester carboxylesterase
MSAGAHYDNFNYVYIVHKLADLLKWNKISFLCHSLGTYISFYYASIFPNKIDIMIAIDPFKIFDVSSFELIDIMETNINGFIKADKQFREKSEPPSYTVEEMIERISGESKGNISRDSASYLLKRNMKESVKYPNKYYFSRDARIRFVDILPLPEELMTAMATRVSMPFIFLRVPDVPMFKGFSYYDSVVDVLKKHNNFHYEIVDSNSHYVHLNEPEKIAGKIADYILKYKNQASHL